MPRIVPLLSLALLLSLVPVVRPSPLGTLTKLKVSKSGVARLKVRGTIPAADRSDVTGFSVRIGSLLAARDLAQFDWSEKTRRYSGVNKAGETKIRVRFDLRTGEFRVRVRTRIDTGEGDPVPEFLLRMRADPAPEPPSDPPPVEPLPGNLRPASELAGESFGWPASDFSPENHAKMTLGRQEGEAAVNFALEDVNGEVHRLSDLLETKPVVLILASRTCPLYRGAIPDLNALATAKYDHRTYDEAVHFVHVYVMEPHPISPDVSPFRGEVWTMEYSTVAQPLTAVGRSANARVGARLLEGRHTVLVDALSPGGAVNPVWETYGRAPNASYLIRRDGIIHFGFMRTRVELLESAIDSLLDETE